MPIVLTRATRAAARYTPAGGLERCAYCRYYMPQGTCGRIEGPVSPRGWCRYFSQELVVQKYHPGQTPVGGVSGAPAIDLSLMGPTLDPSITFTRASVATYFDVAGAMQTATANTPRFDYDPVTHVMRGLLVEETRTNLLLNSATLVTQNATVTAVPYTLSFYGTGTITKSGTASGALVGTGAFPARVSQTFTPTAGTLTLTVTGSVLNAQLEAGAIGTSYISTAGTTAARATETAVISSPASISLVASTLATEYMVPYSALGAGISYASAQVDDGTSSNLLNLRNITGMSAGASVFVAGAPTAQFTAGVVTANAVIKLIAAYNTLGLTGATVLNGGAAVAMTLTNSPAVLTRLAIGFGRSSALNGWIRRVRYWPRVLSNAELQTETT